MNQASFGVGTTWLRINGSSVDDHDYAQLRHPIYHSTTKVTSPTLQLSFQIESILPISEAYGIMALSDFVQVPTQYEGQTQLVHIVPMRPMETREFTLTVPVPQTPGLHKVTLLAFGSTREHTLNELFRFETSGKMFSLSSIDVQVGDDPAPQWPTLDVDRARVNPVEIADGTFQGVVINRTASWRTHWWLFEPVRAGQTLTYEIHLGNDAVSARPYAVLAFLNWIQVPMDAQGHKIFAGRIERDQRLIIDAAVVVPAGEPDTTGQHTHELLVVYIAYPWAKDPEFLDLPLDTNIEGFPALNLWSTNRTALVVQAE